MNKRQKQFLARTLAVAILAASGGAVAQQQSAAPKPETLIKWRQSAFQVIGWNCGHIKQLLEGQYNKEEVVKSANAIAAISNLGLGGLFVTGTEQGKGWHDTNAKPELFKEGSKVGEYAGNFVKEANELAKVSTTGDAAAVKTQFGKLTSTCKSCHDDFRRKDT
jgi:cytochrome c556